MVLSTYYFALGLVPNFYALLDISKRLCKGAWLEKKM